MSWCEWKKLVDISNKKYVKHSWKKKIYCTDQGLLRVQWIRKRPYIVNKITVRTSKETALHKSGNTVLTPWRPSSLLISESFFDVVIVMAMKGNKTQHTQMVSGEIEDIHCSGGTRILTSLFIPIVVGHSLKYRSFYPIKSWKTWCFLLSRVFSFDWAKKINF